MRSINIVIPLLFLAISAGSAADNVSWQIGKADGAYSEFGIAGNHEAYKQEFIGGATFEVGKGDPARNWVYVQPGPGASWAGEGDHPYEVIFFLDELPPNPSVFTINLIDTDPASPATLRVRINDKVKVYDLAKGESRDSLADASKGKKQTITMYVAAGFLHKGRNVINLTVTKGEYVLYDSLSMQPCAQLPHLADEPALNQTYLFKNHDDKLKQIVYGSIDLLQDQKNVRAEIVSELGWRVVQEFTDVQSGQRNLEIEMDPVKESQKAHLKLFVGAEVYEADGIIAPQKQWHIYILPSSHFDYGYTARQDLAMKVHRENIERAIDWCGQYSHVGWDLESSIIAEDYLQNGSRPKEFFELAKQGRIGVMGTYTNTLTGICSSEGLSRVLDYYDYLRNEYGIESDCMMQNDIPTMVGTVPMILRGHGIKYVAQGTNPVHAGVGQLPHMTPYYWESPDGSKVLVLKTVGSYAEAMKVIGLDSDYSTQATMRRINSVVNDYVKRADYPYDAILMHGAYMDNVKNDDSLAKVPEIWNAAYAYPKIIFGKGSEFFERIEKGFADSIPTIKGDGGIWWEDGAASSAKETALNRITESRLPVAEKLVSICGSDLQNDIKVDLADAWKNAILFDEHTWGASCSVDAPESKETLDQWAIKKGFADKAFELTSKLTTQAMDSLCQAIKTAKDTVVIFNPSSWSRSEQVEFDGKDGQKLVLAANDVPPMGYKSFPVARAKAAVSQPVSGDTLDNRYYTIKFDKVTGAVSSIFDKELKRELVDPSQYGLNTYLYVTGGDGSSWDIPHGEKLSISGVRGASLQKLSFPGKQVMKVTCVAPNSRSLVSEIVLYDNEKRIDFNNTIDKIETTRKEGCYFTFPFAFERPDMRVEIPDGVIQPENDQIPRGCRDFYSVQDFLTISDNKAAVILTPIDSPIITLQDIARGQWYEHLDIKNGTVFAYVMNNYWFTNYKASQGGKLQFRFSMTSAKSISDMEAKKFGEQARSPMLCKVLPANKGKSGEPSRSYVQVTGGGVVVQAVKPARFTNGTVLRLREMTGKDAMVSVIAKGIDFKAAYLSNLAEDKLLKLDSKSKTIQVTCKALGLTTLILER